MGPALVYSKNRPWSEVHCHPRVIAAQGWSFVDWLALVSQQARPSFPMAKAVVIPILRRSAVFSRWDSVRLNITHAVQQGQAAIRRGGVEQLGTREPGTGRAQRASTSVTPCSSPQIQRSITVLAPGATSVNDAPLKNAALVQKWLKKLSPKGKWTANAGSGVVS